MILITTAGKVGAEAARLLAQSGHRVRVLARNPDSPRATALARAGVDVVRADLQEPHTIDEAMRDVTSVILVSPAIPAQEINVIDSAARFGVGHVVKITSKASPDSVIGRRRDQWVIEEALIASGLGYTLLRNNAYMQNFLMLAPAISSTSSFGSSVADGRVGMVDARDVGAVAAEIALAPEHHAGKTYWPSGATAISYAEAAEVLSEVLHRTIEFRSITFEEEKQVMMSAGLPERTAEMNAMAVRLFAEGDSDWVTSDVASLLARPARTFHQFAVDNIEAFR